MTTTPDTLFPQLMPGVDSPGLKTFRRGTHRLVTPAETVTRVRRFMKVMGITRVANITGLDKIGIPVAIACRPNSRGLAVSQGKGLDLAAAKASALMESIESYHAERVTLSLKLGSYDGLREELRLIDVTQLPRITNSFFQPSLQLLWIEGYDLLQQEPVWVPYETVETNYTLPFPTGSGCFQATSNGLASGNHLLEAISHGICEVVERDAMSLWQARGYGWRCSRRIDLDTVQDFACREVLDKYNRAGVAVAVWETTTEVGIPSFLCMIAESAEDPLHLLYTTSGKGSHPARSVALLRALTEAAQSRLTFIAGSRDDLTRDSYEQSRNPDSARLLRRQMDIEGPMKDFQRGPSWEGETFHEDVVWELDCLRSSGITRVAVVDLTKPEFQIPVVRVVIPGLEGVCSQPDYVPGARAQALTESLA